MIPQIGIFSTYMNHKDIRIFDHFKMFPVRHYCTYDIFKFRYHHSFVEKYVIKFCKLNEFGEEKRREEKIIIIISMMLKFYNPGGGREMIKIIVK